MAKQEKTYRAYIVKIRSEWFVVEGITEDLNGYHYDLVPLNLSRFIVNYDPKYLTHNQAIGIRNQISKRSYKLYGTNTATLYGIEDNLINMTII